jgi:hypothetical protein
MEIIMSNATRFMAALSIAGAMLVHSPASAQQTVRQAYAPPVFVDCYYNTTPNCRYSGAYATIRPVPYGSYAAINGFTRPPYLATQPRVTRGLTGGDWTAIHGAAP